MILQNFLIENPGIVDTFEFVIHFLVMYAGFLILLFFFYREDKKQIKKYCVFVALQTAAYCFLYPEIQKLIMTWLPAQIYEIFLCWLIGFTLMVIFNAAIYYALRRDVTLTKPLLKILCIQTVCGVVLFELAGKLLSLFYSFLLQF